MDVVNPKAAFDLIRSNDDPKFQAQLRYHVGPQASANIMDTIKAAAKREAEPPMKDLELPSREQMWGKGVTGGDIVSALAHLSLYPASELVGGALGTLRAAVGGGFTGLAVAGGVVGLEYGIAKLLLADKASVGRFASAMAAKGARAAEVTSLGSALSSKVRQYAREYDEEQKRKSAPARKGPTTQTTSLQPPP